MWGGNDGDVGGNDRDVGGSDGDVGTGMVELGDGSDTEKWGGGGADMEAMVVGVRKAG